MSAQSKGVGGFTPPASMLANRHCGGGTTMDAPLDTFRPSTRGWLIGTLAGWGTILLALAGIVLALMGYGLYFLGLAAISLLVILWRWLENMASKFEITEERLIIRRGIVSKSIDEIELYRIKD